LDADGINAFAPAAEPLENKWEQPIVITPHPGEMARLTGTSVGAVQDDRMATARNYAQKNGCYVILKGFQTIIATPAGAAYINPTGNPGMATGGTGDVLAGMVGRFLAGWNRERENPGCPELVDFLCAAVFLHGLAGDLAAETEGEESMIATDLLKYLPQAFRKVRMG
jgi:NAD(P)H-hydrate epimerase